MLSVYRELTQESLLSAINEIKNENQRLREEGLALGVQNDRMQSQNKFNQREIEESNRAIQKEKEISYKLQQEVSRKKDLCKKREQEVLNQKN